MARPVTTDRLIISADAVAAVRRGSRRALPAASRRHAARPAADLDRLAQQSRDAGMEVAVAVEGERRRLPATVEGAAYRLVQEALTNVHKHAGNVSTEVAVCYGRERLEVTVGNARPASGAHPALARAGGGHGLVGLRERVTLLGGTFVAGPRADGGFEVSASIPAEVPA